MDVSISASVGPARLGVPTDEPGGRVYSTPRPREAETFQQAVVAPKRIVLSTAPFRMAGWHGLRGFRHPAARYAAKPLSAVFSDSFDEADVWTVEGTDGAGGRPLWHVSSDDRREARTRSTTENEATALTIRDYATSAR
jgi:hypothetical protein